MWLLPIYQSHFDTLYRCCQLILHQIIIPFYKYFQSMLHYNILKSGPVRGSNEPLYFFNECSSNDYSEFIEPISIPFTGNCQQMVYYILPEFEQYVGNTAVFFCYYWIFIEVTLNLSIFFIFICDRPTVFFFFQLIFI